MCCAEWCEDQNEVVIQAAINTLEIRSAEIREMVYANHYQEIINLREKVKSAIAVEGYEAYKNEMKVAIRKERELLAKARYQKNHSSELMLELVGVDMQIDDLKKELYQLTLSSLIKP